MVEVLWGGEIERDSHFRSADELDLRVRNVCQYEHSPHSRPYMAEQSRNIISDHWNANMGEPVECGG